MDNINKSLQIKLNFEDAIIPKKGSTDAAGYDLYSYQLNKSETLNEGYKNRIIDNIQLELHIPLYKLWEKK